MELLSFTIADKEYAVNIGQVRQAIRIKEITPVPEAADFVEGVMNLGGKIIALVNLRKKFGLPKIELDKRNRIILTQIDSHLVGIIVDRVNDVISLDNDSIEPPDEVLKEARYLIGVGKIAGRPILVVDMEKILTGEDKLSISQVHDRVEVRKKPARQE